MPGQMVCNVETGGDFPLVVRGGIGVGKIGRPGVDVDGDLNIRY